MNTAPLRTTHLQDKLSTPTRNLSVVNSLFANTDAGERILIADQDPLTVELLKSLPDRERYRFVSVTDGREAFRLLQRDANFHAAIFNMTMPHLHGVDIVKYMKTEKRLMRIPVVLVGGESGIQSVADSFAAGALAFQPKPFSAEQLYRTLRLALGTISTVEVRCAA